MLHVLEMKRQTRMVQKLGVLLVVLVIRPNNYLQLTGRRVLRPVSVQAMNRRPVHGCSIIIYTSISRVWTGSF